MTSTDWINNLSILVLIALLVAAIFLITLLYRANKMLYKIEHLSETAKDFVKEIVPAIVNMGTMTTAIQAILRTLGDHHTNHSKKD